MEKAILTIDIGMTNKKIHIYDYQFKVLAVAEKSFSSLMVSGIEAHDLKGIEDWLLEKIAWFALQYNIQAIAISAHGATQVCINKDGTTLPCYYYTHEPGQDFHNRFYERIGKSAEELQARTATPNFSSLINSAKGLYFLQEIHPDTFAQIKTILNYPQYWGYILTSRVGAECSYVGCHSYLWDWIDEKYSQVTKALQISKKLPKKILPSWSILGRINEKTRKRTGLQHNTVVTMGVHDSNASLLPHLLQHQGMTESDFILNSTGTWCVLMHPQEEFSFSDDDMGKIVFFNRSIENKPVKTAIFLGGLEYDYYMRRIGGKDEYTPSVYQELLEKKNYFILPELVPGSGQFPGSRAGILEVLQNGQEVFTPLVLLDNRTSTTGFFANKDKAIACLNICLAAQTVVALERCGIQKGCKIITEGGFKSNRGYLAMLSCFLPENPLYLTDISEASSLGAAICARAAIDNKTPKDYAQILQIAYTFHPPLQATKSYLATFIAKIKEYAQ